MNHTDAPMTLNRFTVKTPECVSDFFRQHMIQKSGYKPSRSLRFALMLLARTSMGRLEVVLPDQTTLTFTGRDTGPEAILYIHNDRMARRFITGGKLGFCEAYLDGDWSSPDIALLFEFMLRNGDVMKKAMLGRWSVRALSYLIHALQPNTRRGSKRNIYSHYDIGNDFYARWLDPSMTYSSALFDAPDMTLSQGQQRKYEEMAKRLDLKDHHHVLEIGCGWGGFAEYAAREIGCKVTGVTVSQAQFEYATKRIQSAGLSDKVDIRLEDYRDIGGQFDAIASIEMFEAVGEAYWPVYFSTLRERLKSGAKACLQIITINEEDFPTYRKSADYIQRYIFPGGMLPSLSALKQQIARAGLLQADHISFGKDYARTLRLWNESFQKVWPKLKNNTLDERFKRLWEQYFAYCEAGFQVGKIDVIQIDIVKP